MTDNDHSADLGGHCMRRRMKQFNEIKDMPKPDGVFVRYIMADDAIIVGTDDVGFALTSATLNQDNYLMTARCGVLGLERRLAELRLDPTTTVPVATF